ncbi:MAG: carboxypeptidase regulatory-like domain-containing protein [Acidobacteriota bacterium]|nr:carboxypeptidase regulatory-like domain-containing protein [Blastocatellia bacterium]MDW8413627.1 carboxypeptidase regulatory-like domain-containing protein [Acidobacteriota bacterium]
MRKSVKILLCLFIGLAIGATDWSVSFAQSQINAADLMGTVVDENGAVLSGIRLTLRSPATGYTREATSGEDGSFRFLAVPPGMYEVTAEGEGFSKYVSKEIKLTVGQVASLEVQMKIGNVTEEVVTVTGTQIIETSRTSVAETINQTAINNLPSNGRSYVNFTLLTSTASRDNQPVLGPGPTSGLNFGGQRARANNVSIDGADATDNATNGVRSSVSQEAVQEFQIQTNSYAAEFGRASSAVINIVTKGGTNELHGNLFAFLRDQAVSADNPLSFEPGYAATRFQGGTTLGGPIKRNKTFFFFAFETTQRNETGFSQIGRDGFGLIPVSPGDLAVAVGPAPALLTPAQAAFVRNTAVPFQVRAVYFGLAREASSVALTGKTTTGAGVFFATRVPLPQRYVPLNTLIGNYPQYEKSYFPSLRIDHRFNNSNNAFVRISFTSSTVGGTPSNGQNQPSAINAFSRTGFTGARDFAVVAQNMTTASSGIVNEARFQFARRGLNYGPNGLDVGIEVAGFASFGREPFSPVFRTEKRTQLTDNMTIIRGGHTFKFGVDYNFVQTDATFEVNFGGIYSFTSILPTSPLLASLRLPANAPPFTPVQAYGLGFPESFVQSFGNPTSKFNNPSLGLFVQDSWKIRPNFTMNYGIRYDVEFTKRFNPVNELVARAEEFFQIQQGLPRDYDNFAPRLAISWDPFKDGKTVIKAAYGLFVGRPLLGVVFLSDVNDGAQSPFLAVPNVLGAVNIFQGAQVTPGPGPNVPGYLPGQSKFNPFAPALSDQNTLLRISPVLPQTLHIARSFEYDYTSQANLAIERQLASNLGIGVTYSFIKGSKLLRPRNINQANSQLVIAYRRALAGDTTSPLIGLVRALGPAAAAGELIFNGFRASGPNFAFAQQLGLSEAQVRALARQFGLPQVPGAFIPFFNVKNYESSGSSVYHAMTVNVTKRFSNNFQFLSSYTWSHAIDDSTDIQTQQEPQDNSNPGLDRGNSNFDQRHRFVFSGVFLSPFDRSAGGMNYFLADWTFAPIIEIGAGRPHAVLTENDRTFANSSSTARPDVVPLGTPGSFPSPDGKVGLILPPLGRVGNLGRNVYTTPPFASVDFRLSRKFYLPQREGMNLEFIFEVFNLFNRTNISEVQFFYERAGQPVAAQPARQIQFAFKFNF